jgi:2-(1,2-epoxy-1,2-dihydrophenyl)acetyl-CoA isomerase
MGDAPTLLTEVADRVGTITLNRPEKLNALDSELMGLLHDAVNEMAENDEVKVVVVTGAAREGKLGGFCAGGDVKSGKPGPGFQKGLPSDALEGDLSRHDVHASMRLHMMPKPTIAMIGGPAVGAGASLAAACDLRFASDDAVIAMNFIPNGITGDYGGSFFWTSIVGTGLTRRLFLLNEKIPAAEAQRLGLVHEVRPAAELHDYTYGIAAQLAKVPAPVLALTKDNLNAAEEDVARRRWLLAHEVDNQREAVRSGKKESGAG